MSNHEDEPRDEEAALRRHVRQTAWLVMAILGVVVLLIVWYVLA